MSTKTVNRRPLMGRFRGRSSAPEEALPAQPGPRAPDQLLSPERSSVVSEGARIRGDIASPGTVHINGTLEGNVRAEKVVIGRHGMLTGNCRAQDVAIAGDMTGELLCVELRVFETGGIDGTINCGRISVSGGARIDAVTQTNGQDDLPEISLIQGAAAS